MLSPKLCALGVFFIIATGCGPSGTDGSGGNGHLGSGGAGGAGGSGGGPGPGIIIGPGAPNDAPSRFGGTIDPTRAPRIVYPADGVLLPPNLNDFEFHFQPAGDTTLFRLSLPNLDIYFGCQQVSPGCVFTLDKMTWMALAARLRSRPMQSYTLAAVNGTNPGNVGISAPRTLAVADMDLTGGIYYWNAAAGQVKRYDFGLDNQTAENFMDAPRAGAMQCVGCHVLSRDGSRIAVGMDIPAPSPFKVFDVATRSMIFQQGTQFMGGANFFSFSPDNMQLLTSSGANITWRNAQTGMAIGTDPLVPLGAMPDWSPDGMHMVYAKPQTAPPCPVAMFCGGMPGVDAAGLEVMPFNGTTWGASTPLVPFSGQNNYYPSYSPDGGWVMFNRSPSNHNSYDAPDAQVWVVPQSGGSAVQLAKASTGGDSWPKWAPIVQMWQGRPILWFTFSSRRAYGLRIAAGTNAQVWMAAFDPSGASDPSFPAFWLPFQEPTSGNHIAQWVLNVDRMGCTIDSQCATNEFCVGGRCLPRPM
jgi:TolB protein